MAQTGATYNLIADNNIIPWFDDNEIKYKWNGALTNLSNMDPKDYATTIFNIYGIVITGSTGSTLIANKVDLVVTEEEGKYVINVTSVYPFLTDQQIKITLAGTEFMIIMHKNETTGKIATGISVSGIKPKITSASITPGKDEVYSYELDFEADVDEFIVYHGVVLEKDAVSLTVSDIIAMQMSLINKDGKILEFEIPRRLKEFPTEEELKDCKYCLILCLPKKTYDNGEYEISDAVIGASSGFIKQEPQYIINGEVFNVLCNYSDGNEFVGRYGKEITYNFKVNYKQK